MSIANIDFDRFRLRSLMNSLAQKGEVEIDNEPTDLADVAIKLFGKTKAVWFRKVPIDPSLNGLFTGAKVGFDLTWPFGGGKRLEDPCRSRPFSPMLRFRTCMPRSWMDRSHSAS